MNTPELLQSASSTVHPVSCRSMAWLALEGDTKPSQLLLCWSYSLDVREKRDRGSTVDGEERQVLTLVQETSTFLWICGICV